MLGWITTSRRRAPSGTACRLPPAAFCFMTAKTIRHYLQFKDFSLEDYEYVLERTGIS